jgi:hypothetical protein
MSTYDEARRETVLFGGATIFGSLGDTWVRSWRGSYDESCWSGVDLDGDGAIGCADSDCASVCTQCGDGACEPIEEDRMCPMDCAPSSVCGDAFCSGDESAATCPADC